MNRQDKIDAIYKEIANKELSFGCKVMITYNDKRSYKTKYIQIRNNTFWLEDDYIHADDIQKTPEWGFEDDEIIGHPVLIGDVLDWIEKTYKEECKVRLDIQGKHLKNAHKLSDTGDFLERTFDGNNQIRHNYTIRKVELLLNDWKNKRLPIEEQSEECIDYIYNLL